MNTTRKEPRFLHSLALAALTLPLGACANDVITFDRPGRVPPEPEDLIIQVDGVARGFGSPELAKDGEDHPMIWAEIAETATTARIRIPRTASTMTCTDAPKAIVLETSRPAQHESSHYNIVSWSATECTITVSRIDATASKGAEGSFSATLVRDKDEVGEKTIEGPKTLVISGTFVASSR